MEQDLSSKSTFTDCDIQVPIELAAGPATTVLFSCPSREKTTGNEDAAGFWIVGKGRYVLAVADGMGGTRGGAEAAAIAIDAIDGALGGMELDESARGEIVDAFENANERVLKQGIGAGTTLVVAEVNADTVRTYHAGDSGAILVGQRGRLRLATIPHSPTGYAVASGMLEQDDAHHHEERHLLSNCIGSREMRVEISAPTRMGVRDTLLLGSDGVIDNVQRKELVDIIRVGPLKKSATTLLGRVQTTMYEAGGELPAQPDDATALLFRRTGR